MVTGYAVISATVLAAVGISWLLESRLGFGSPFNDVVYKQLPSRIPETNLEVVASLPHPPGNIAVSPRGRVFFTFHPEYHPDVKVAELRPNSVRDATTTYFAYPNVSYQSTYISCLSLRVDRLNRLWVLDFSNHGTSFAAPSLHVFQLDSGKKTDFSGAPADGTVGELSTLSSVDRKHRDVFLYRYFFPSHVAGTFSMLNDFQIDSNGRFIYIADTSILGLTPALIVYSVQERTSFRILSSHSSMFGMSTILNIANTSMHIGPLGVKIHVDSIALSRDGNVLYFGALSGHNLYSIPTKVIREYIGMANDVKSSLDELEFERNHIPALTSRTTFMSYKKKKEMSEKENNALKALKDAENKLASFITLVSTEKPVTDGMSVDAYGNIWFTASEDGSIGVFMIPTTLAMASKTSDFFMRKVVASESYLRWPDGLSFSDDGLYITNSVLHSKFMTGEDQAKTSPYHILRLPKEVICSYVYEVPENVVPWPSSGQ